MEAYQGYFKGERFIPLENVTIPENRRVIVTVLDDAVSGPELEICALLEEGLEDMRAGRGKLVDEAFAGLMK